MYSGVGTGAGGHYVYLPPNIHTGALEGHNIIIFIPLICAPKLLLIQFHEDPLHEYHLELAS